MSLVPTTHLDALQSFAVFANTLNLSESARQLHISQPALHAKLRKLSEQLRVPLYVRQGRQLKLTAEGLEVARHARELLAFNQRFIQGMSGAAGTDAVSLVAGDGAYLHLIGKALTHFRSSSKAMALKLLTGNRERAIASVEHGEAQLGVAPLGEMASALDSQPLTSVGQVLIVPRSHPLALQRFMSLKDLRDQFLVVPHAGRPHRELLGQLLEAKGIRWHVAVETNSWGLMMQFAAWGLGLAVVNAFCPAPRGTVAIPLKGYPPLTYHVFHRKGQRLDPATSRLRDSLLTHAEQWRTDLSLPQWS
ncbi:LysR family transcriptional regulator [Acidovorax sacchari]|uniref:LysR family transcriptional regulator n=1 Tax=Acidovorax sacchari TaxID=3230736 RepID=UPI0039E6E7D5